MDPKSKPDAAPRGDPPTALPQVVVPAGYRLVREDDMEREALRREKLLADAVAETSRPLAERVQSAMDRMYPKAPGSRLFRVQLNDKNGHPELVVPARSDREARACYEHVCGILYVEDADKKYAVSEAP